MKIYAELIGNYKKHRIKSLCVNKLRKQKERLEAALPSILDGYCDKSEKPRAEAEQEAKEFLQIIEDSASYQFGYNHSIAYCMLGYYCAYYRYHYPLAFITAFLNNAANDEDIQNGTIYANKQGIKITMPKWGISRGNYSYDTDKNIIAKGMSSIKFIGKSAADRLYEVSQKKEYHRFIDVLQALSQEREIDARVLNILIKIDFFSEFGNQRELLKINEMFEFFNKGRAHKIAKSKVEYSPTLKDIIEKYSIGITKSGKEAKSYAIMDMQSLLEEIEDTVKSYHISDLPVILKIQNSKDALGYVGYVSGKEEDYRKLFVTNVFPVSRRKDGVRFGYNVLTQSIGTGKPSKFTVFNSTYDKDPIKKDDIIFCADYRRDVKPEGVYYTLTKYNHLYS